LQLGETEKEGRENLKEMLLIQKLMEKKMGDIEISDEAARTHFEENKKQYSKPEQVKARHILIKTEEMTKEEAEKELQSIKSKIEAGNADFAEMAKKHSQGPSGERGGDLGYFSRGQMVPSFEEAAFGAEPGEIVGPVETQFGLHLIKVEDKKEPSQQKFEDVKEQIKQRLLQQQQQQKAQQIIEELRAESDVQIAE
jgi:parvulin-like peptidyl-prolyl isomerase